MLIANISTTMMVWLNIFFLLIRYAHISSAMLMVGGFLFYEMVVPIAIAELKNESQLAVFARARWVFRWIVWVCAITTILTGIYMTTWRMQSYVVTEFPSTIAPSNLQDALQTPWILRTGWWWAAHVISATIALLVAFHLVIGNRMPTQPLNLIKLDIMLLLIVVFFATVTRQVDSIQQERMLNLMQSPAIPYYTSYNANDTPTTLPATAPAITP